MSLDVERLAIYLNASFGGLEFIDELFIAEDVKPNTSAVYIEHRGSNRMIVYITKFNTLGCVECGSDVDDEQEWEEASLDGVGSIAIHNNSRIASISRDSKTLIFYQTPAGSIGSIMYDSGEKKWAHRETTEAAPAAAPGTPVFALRLTDAFGLFYLSDDRNICGLLQKYDNSGCQKLAFNNSLFEGEVDNFIILPNDQADGFEAYVRAANDLVHITSTGERSNLGKWAAVGFIPDSDAERGKRIRPGLYTLGGHASSSMSVNVPIGVQMRAMSGFGFNC